MLAGVRSPGKFVVQAEVSPVHQLRALEDMLVAGRLVRVEGKVGPSLSVLRGGESGMAYGLAHLRNTDRRGPRLPCGPYPRPGS